MGKYNLNLNLSCAPLILPYCAGFQRGNNKTLSLVGLPKGHFTFPPFTTCPLIMDNIWILKHLFYFLRNAAETHAVATLNPAFDIILREFRDDELFNITDNMDNLSNFSGRIAITVSFCAEF